ncbi:cellulose biosynthesis protein BcsF [Zobellella sp. An-6]|uniref:cellulose biosynthesis protein BcsF n=1 Tax=Zobellella sp. An-6 TaxID=3400218 RepID=UPI0040423360
MYQEIIQVAALSSLLTLALVVVLWWGGRRLLNWCRRRLSPRYLKARGVRVTRGGTAVKGGQDAPR